MNNKTCETYSMNYNKPYQSQKSCQINQVKKFQTIVANSPTLKKYVPKNDKSKSKALISNIHLQPEIKKNNPTINKDDVCIKAKSSKKILFYKILYCCIILSLSSLGIYIFSSTGFNSSPLVDVSSSCNNEYLKILSSVVMNDPAPFDNPQNADIQMVISSSIWKLITENGTQKYNQFDERGLSLMPASDIIKASKELFGENYNLNLNESIFGSFFTFYKGEENFHISAISNQNSCVPFVKDLTETEDSLILNVWYVSRDDKFLKSDSEKTEEPNPIKCMKYTLKKNNENSSYYIFSVENT